MGSLPIKMRSHPNRQASLIGQGKLKNQPLVEASIYGTLAGVYDILGYYGQSIPHKARQYDILQKYGQPGNVVKNYLALTYRRAGEYKQAESLFNELIPDLPRISKLYRPSRCNLAHVYFNDRVKFHECRPIY